MASRMRFVDFVTRAREVHGETYDYSRSLYGFAGAQRPVPIRCAEHGFFRQEPSRHLAGHGCPKCAQARIAAAGREQFLAMHARRRAEQAQSS